MSEKVRKILYEGDRVGTGAVQFGDDWPGLFIRGDNCIALLLSINAVLETTASANVDLFKAMRALRNIAVIISEDVLIPLDGGGIEE